MTPGSAGGFTDAALPVGSTWISPEGASVRVNSASSSGVNVTINNPTSGIPGAPQGKFIVASKLSADAIPTVPYKVSWTQGTCSTNASYTLSEAVDGGAFLPVFSGAGLTTTVHLLPDHVYGFRAACGGSAAGGQQFSLDGSQETAATYSGAWTAISATGAWGGTAKYSPAKGAYAKFTCTCDAITWVTDEDSNHGSAKVYLDGILKKTVDTQSSTKKNRVIVFKAAWPSTGTHKIKIVNLGTSGHPRVNVDGFLTRTAS
jgi:hypothetical protein